MKKSIFAVAIALTAVGAFAGQSDAVFATVVRGGPIAISGEPIGVPMNAFPIGFVGETKDGCKVISSPLDFGAIPFEKGNKDVGLLVDVRCSKPMSIQSKQVPVYREDIQNGTLEIQFEELTRQNLNGYEFRRFKATLGGVGGLPINKTGNFEIKELLADVGQEVVKLRSFSPSIGSVESSCTITPGQPPTIIGCKGLEYTVATSNGDGTQTIRFYNEKNQLTGSKVLPEEKPDLSRWTIIDGKGGNSNLGPAGSKPKLVF